MILNLLCEEIWVPVQHLTEIGCTVLFLVPSVETGFDRLQITGPRLPKLVKDGMIVDDKIIVEFPSLIVHEEYSTNVVSAINGEKLGYYGLGVFVGMENTVVFPALREVIGPYVVLAFVCCVADVDEPASPTLSP